MTQRADYVCGRLTDDTVKMIIRTGAIARVMSEYGDVQRFRRRVRPVARKQVPSAFVAGLRCSGFLFVCLFVTRARTFVSRARAFCSTAKITRSTRRQYLEGAR